MSDCGGIQEDLVSDLEVRSKWRTQMAARYPSDERHTRSAEALATAAGEVAALPDDDARLVHLGEFYRTSNDDEILKYLDVRNAIMSKHGFENHATTDDLLSALADAAARAGRGEL